MLGYRRADSAWRAQLSNPRLENSSRMDDHELKRADMTALARLAWVAVGRRRTSLGERHGGCRLGPTGGDGFDRRQASVCHGDVGVQEVPYE